MSARGRDRIWMISKIKVLLDFSIKPIYVLWIPLSSGLFMYDSVTLRWISLNGEPKLLSACIFFSLLHFRHQKTHWATNCTTYRPSTQIGERLNPQQQYTLQQGRSQDYIIGGWETNKKKFGHIFNKKKKTLNYSI